MLRRILFASCLLGVAGAASAEPLRLSEPQLDAITAGRLILAVAFERVVQSDQQGLFVHLLQLDEETGELSVRTFGSSLPIPATPIVGIGATINTRG